MLHEQLLQVVGLDIVTIGLLVIFGFHLAQAMVNFQAHSPSPFKQAAMAFEQQVAYHKQPDSLAKIGASVAVLLFAAATGAMLNLVADRALDSDWIRSVRLPYPDWDPSTGEMSWPNKWAPEDGIKLESYNKVRRILRMQKSQANKVCEDWGKPGYKYSEGTIKELYQRAYLAAQVGGANTLRISDADKRRMQEMLAREEVFVKLFRVMLAIAVILAVVSFSTAWTFLHGLPLALLVVSSSLFWKLGTLLCGGWPLLLLFLPGASLLCLLQSGRVRASQVCDEAPKETPPINWTLCLVSAAACLMGLVLFVLGGPCSIVPLALILGILLIFLRSAWRKRPVSPSQTRVWLVQACGGTLACLLVVFSFVLWSAQSKRYYKKVFHAYLMVDDNAIQLFWSVPNCRDLKAKEEEHDSE